MRKTDVYKIAILAGMAVLISALLIFHPWKGKEDASSNRYISKDYKVTLVYPEVWEAVDGNKERYVGTNGFFEVSAAGKSLNVAALAGSETNHVLRPYGTNPTIEYTDIDGKEAAIIMPSGDQDPSMENQAALLVAYPEPVRINNNDYYYLVLWADKDHIRELGKTLNFL